jgi:hypothetical protein
VRSTPAKTASCVTRRRGFYAVPDTACFSDLQALIGPPSGTRFACAVDESAVLACIDDVWGITEPCVEGARCGGQLGDISCE